MPVSDGRGVNPRSMQFPFRQPVRAKKHGPGNYPGPCPSIIDPPHSMVGVVLAARLLVGVLAGTLEAPEASLRILFLERRPAALAVGAGLLVRVGVALRPRLGLV